MNILDDLKALPHGAERRTVEWDELRPCFSGSTDRERWDDFDAWLLAWHLSHEIKKHDIAKDGTYTITLEVWRE